MKELVELSPQEAMDALESTLPKEKQKHSWVHKRPHERMTIALQVLTLVQQGKTLRTIGQIMGFTHETARKYRDLALLTIQTPIIEDARKEMLQVLDQIVETNMEKVLEGDEKATTNVLKALERKSKLLGLDAPQRVDTVVYEATPQEQELKHLLDAAAQAEADRERTITGEVVESDYPSTT